MTFTPEEAEEDGLGLPEGDRRPRADRPRRRRQSGGDLPARARPGHDRPLTGLRPFLDDVTVSRKHAVIAKDSDAFRIEDEGSLNGTFVNKKRVEASELENGDELQIGKYRLTYLSG